MSKVIIPDPVQRAARACRLLDGTNVAPGSLAEAKALIGRRIEYLRTIDIDRSDRGYFWPRRANVTGARGREIEIDGGDFITIRALVEVIDLGPAP